MTKRAAMRWLFLLLLLANVVFLVYGYVARAPDDAGAQIERLQLHPERIKLVGRGDGLKSEIPAPAASVACLEWGLFAGPYVARADAAMSRLNLPPGSVQRAVLDAGGYWVYIPPPRTKADVDLIAEDLRARRVADFFVVQEPPQWRNAISLGIFKTEESANKLLGELQDKGVHSAVMERRENVLKQIAYYVRQPGIAVVARLAELQRDFPGSEVKAAPCPTGN